MVQGLGIIVWSVAKLGCESGRIRGLLSAFANEALRRLLPPRAEGSRQLGAQSLSNMVYAFAVLGFHPGADVLSAVAVGVQWQLRDFSPQVVSLSPPCMQKGRGFLAWDPCVSRHIQ